MVPASARRVKNIIEQGDGYKRSLLLPHPVCDAGHAHLCESLAGTMADLLSHFKIDYLSNDSDMR
jgi:hypothetical protein